MKVRSIKIKNIKSFKEKITIKFNDNLNLIIGPNGSGKSNLLDILTVTLRHFFFSSFQIGLQDGFTRTLALRGQPFQQIDRYLESFIGCKEEKEIELELVVGRNDINNIKAIKKNKENFKNILRSFFQIAPDLDKIKGLDYIDKWDLSKLKANQKFTYKIVNNALVNPNEGTSEWIFLSYLQRFDLFLQLSDELAGVQLRPPYIYFSPYRNSSDAQMSLQVNLMENLYELLAGYYSATSRQNTSLTKIAGLFFGQKRRDFEIKAKKFGYENMWNSDRQVKMLKKELDKIRYQWDLRYNRLSKGSYEFFLKKDSKDFQIGQASSGEKEVFNFFLGIIAFVKNDGLFLVDEPELHLHPNWQNLLISFFGELSKATNSQFIISTHSPIFITSETLSSTMRFYKNEDNSSNRVTIPSRGIRKTREMLHIINSLNNEKLFFADKVILVEGISDRLIFKRIVDKLDSRVEKNEVVEVLEVGSKDNLLKYRTFLNLMKVANYIIADLDYLEDLGNSKIKRMFVSDEHSVIENVFKNKGSKDRRSLLQKLDDAVKTNNTKELSEFMKYIKGRHLELRKNLTKSERKNIKAFLTEKRKEGIYILGKGDIENYFDLKKHDLDKIIELVEEKNFAREMSIKKGKTKELIKIVQEILGLEKHSIKSLFKALEPS